MAVPPGCARVAPVCTLPELLRQFGVDPVPIMIGAGIDPHVLDDPDNSLSYRDFCRLLATCVAATDCPHIGLLLGQQAGLATLGPVARVARHAPDAATALRSFESYLHTFNRACTVSVSIEDGNAVFAYSITEPGLVATEQMYDLCLSVMFNVMRELCGLAWRPLAVRLPHRAPADQRPFKRFFGSSVVFDAEHAALVFPAKWLTQPLRAADADLRSRYLREMAVVDAATERSVHERVRWLLHASLPQQWLSEDEVAKRLKIDSSTLRRQLRRESSSFRRIAAEVRYEAAKHFLQHSGMTMNRLAALLGYSELSAFTRAFRSWAGMPPSRWQISYTASDRPDVARPARDRRPIAADAS